MNRNTIEKSNLVIVQKTKEKGKRIKSLLKAGAAVTTLRGNQCCFCPHIFLFSQFQFYRIIIYKI